MADIRHRIDESQSESVEHVKLIESDTYQETLIFLKRTIQDFLHTLKICEIATFRSREFTDNYLLPRYLDDIVEAALTARLAIENGMINPARRELRQMLEVAVNISYVDEIRAKDTLDGRANYYKGKKAEKSNVDPIFQLPFRMLGDNKALFACSVRNAWVRTSKYVHLTKNRVDQKLFLREEGMVLGLETLAMLQDVVSEVYEICSIVIVLVFETIGPSFTGDLLVDSLDECDNWVFYANKYISIIDVYFDYKHERKEKLEQISQRRVRRIKYHTDVNSPFLYL
jgi:hypothetical protein